MISEIGFSNFKRFQEERLDFNRPITLLYGENSSGKSSVLKGIASIIQTFSIMHNKYEPFVAQGEYANLGIYKDYVHNHDVSRKVTISLIIPPDRWMGVMTSSVGKLDKFEVDLCYDRSPYTEQARIYSIEVFGHTDEGMRIELFKLKRAETKSYYTLVTHVELLRRDVYAYGHRAKVSDKEIARVAKLKTKLNYVQGFTFHATDVKAEGDISAYKIRIFDRFVSFLFNIPESYKYLGPLRSSPSRSYTLSAASSDVGPRGENTPSVISYLKRSGESIKLNKEAFRKILHWVDLIFPGRSIRVEDYEELVKLKVTRNSELGNGDSIQDVGFGFSQVLPIIVQVAAMGVGHVIVIEQPELHLHPRAQVAFSKFLVEACREGKRFIIETHSEHILRGLQLAISQNSLKPTIGLTNQDLMVYYFPSEISSSAFEIEISEEGELVYGWPAGFFDESYNLTKEIIGNKIKKLTGEAI
ncbi:DUF3696 domain-containing protein [Pseudomonas urmiensis]|uniref:DUF3696 domain-containing protein n=1 Tax=Pseudomonas urmiensis TaxID=2745493 RepID=UPI003CBD1163